MTARLLYYDVECTPLTVHAWSLRDLNVGLSQIVEDPRLLCVAWKWNDEKQIHFTSEWGDGRMGMLQRLHDAFDEADVALGYNSVGFDTPWVQGELAREGFLPPSPFKQVDLYKQARKHFRYPSHKLQYVSGALSIGSKIETGGFGLWTKVMAGDERARAKMERYCKKDVALLPVLHKRLLPWIGNGPNLNLFGEPVIGEDGKPVAQLACPNCTSTKVQRRGWVVKQSRRYRRLHCQSCGSWSAETTADAEMKVGAVGEAR